MELGLKNTHNDIKESHFLLLRECYMFAYLLSSKFFILMQITVNVFLGNFNSYKFC